MVTKCAPRAFPRQTVRRLCTVQFAAPGCDDALLMMPSPFVLQFYGQPSSYIWEDEMGEVHDIVQGEGGKQGDPLMPALFALGQHDALQAVYQRAVAQREIFRFLG